MACSAAVAVAGLGAGGRPAAADPLRWAASCSRADVQKALDAAQDGDTVVVPAGICSWKKQVGVAGKAVRLKGAGIGRTVLVDRVPKSGLDQKLLNVETVAGKPFRLTGFTVRGGGTAHGWNGIIRIGGASKQWRVDHVAFERPRSSALRVFGDTYGVVDHCGFDLDGTQGVVVWHNDWAGVPYGDASWSTALALGTDAAVYVEDNTFTSTWAAGAIDGLAGARFVFRFNAVTEDFVASHGTESTQRYRSVRSFEIYGNTMTHSDWFTAVFLRGGTGVVFDNTLAGYGDAVQLSNFRSDSAYVPWGRCDGTNPFDGNQEANGYPCLDQVGRGTGDPVSGDEPQPQAWPNQVLDPVYAWNNTVGGGPGSVESRTAVIQEGRDYVVGVARPGYTPLGYPHPLVAADAASDVLPPTTPANVLATAASGFQVDLAWDPATDATSVAGYNVYRDGLLVASAAQTQYADGSVFPTSTHTYTITAYDAEGNESEPSGPVSVDTGPLVVPAAGFVVRTLRGRLASAASPRQPGDLLKLLVELGTDLLPNGAGGTTIGLSVGGATFGPFTTDARGCFQGSHGAAGTVAGCASLGTRRRKLRLKLSNVDLESALGITPADTEGQVGVAVGLEAGGAGAGPNAYPASLRRSVPGGSAVLKFRL